MSQIQKVLQELKLVTKNKAKPPLRYLLEQFLKISRFFKYLQFKPDAGL